MMSMRVLRRRIPRLDWLRDPRACGVSTAGDVARCHFLLRFNGTNTYGRDQRECVHGHRAPCRGQVERRLKPTFGVHTVSM